MDGKIIMEAIALLQTQSGGGIPRWYKILSESVKWTGIALIWAAHIMIFLWLRNGA